MVERQKKGTQDSKASNKPNGGTPLWWERFEAVKDYYQQHGSYEGISKALKFYPSWRGNIRNGSLSEGQRQALKGIKFPFESLQKPSTRVQETLSLQQAWKERGLTKVERRKLTGHLQYFKDRYRWGVLSEKTARQVGIIENNGGPPKPPF